jgi:hypothetical protein
MPAFRATVIKAALPGVASVFAWIAPAAADVIPADRMIDAGALSLCAGVSRKSRCRRRPKRS